MQVFLLCVDLDSLMYKPRSGLGGLYASYMFNCFKNLNTESNCCSNSFPATMWKPLPHPLSLLSLLNPCFFFIIPYKVWGDVLRSNSWHTLVPTHIHNDLLVINCPITLCMQTWVLGLDQVCVNILFIFYFISENLLVFLLHYRTFTKGKWNKN